MYTLLYDRRIEKDLRPIPASQRRLLLQKAARLTLEPRQPQVEKLEGSEGYRLRAGDYRILFTIDDRTKTVTVYRIRHRRDAYR